jgi:heme/copper-type cytochrome/quinol oxidase subunit 2
MQQQVVSSLDIDCINYYTMTNETWNDPDQSGAWLVTCWTHILLDLNHYWMNVEVQNMTMKQIFSIWYQKMKRSSNQGENKNYVIDGE